MKKIALLLKVIKNDLRVLWYALGHPNRPVWLMPAIVLVALYAIDPFNVAVPFVGIVDDGVLVPMALHLMVRCLPPELQRLRRR
ncbi:YkvA family protein [Caballeronia sp.]|uniref:YkvA family protein n=1 Tax=Caballeronia sp. TaxID=1931223 RepID=UPI003C69F5B3